jgi:hypothetical protein
LSRGSINPTSQEIIQLSSNLEEAARYERLSKSTGDRELAAYYAAKASELRSPEGMLATAKEQLEEVKRRATAEVTQELWARKARRASKPTGDKMVNETARQGLLANAEACEREAVEWERKAAEKTAAVLRAPRELVGYYNEQSRAMRAHAELARSRADSFRRAAASLA